MITSVDTVTQVSIKFRKKKKSNKNMGISIEHHTNKTYENGDKCVRKIEKKTYTNDTNPQKQANRQGMGWREPPMLLFFNLFFSNSEALIRPSNSDVSARL